MLTIDGNYLEGGGQIVRTALALSTLTGISFRCTNIRQGRKDAGLKAQHLTAIKALEDLCGATCEGAMLGSTDITFFPKPIKKYTLSIDIGTAGSISLLLQALLPSLLFADKRIVLRITGGTDVQWAMPTDFMQHVLIPQLQRFADITMILTKRGYYPKGQGEIMVKIKPRIRKSPFDDFLLTTRRTCHPYALTTAKELLCIKGISHASMDLQDARVAERQARAAEGVFRKRHCPLVIDAAYYTTASTGSGITLWTMFGKDEEDTKRPIRLGADALGERGKKAEVVGEEVAHKLLASIMSGAAVDSHTMDNLLPFLALAGGKICSTELSTHARTNIYVIEQFLGPTFTVDGCCVSVLCSVEEPVTVK
ncbi:RNA 3'-terminal phosphate cyclase [Candidatus Woesearchaeota archaeon]|nr:RNA 3'-terminal phosphate cyclase [Candidatus Woesearchaeota archaeon]